MSTEYPPELGSIWKQKGKAVLMIKVEGYPRCMIEPIYGRRKDGTPITKNINNLEFPTEYISWSRRAVISVSYVICSDPKWIGVKRYQDYTPGLWDLYLVKVHSPSELSASNYQHTYSC